MFRELSALAQPGAITAVAIVLLLMTAGDVAIVIAARGWPL